MFMKGEKNMKKHNALKIVVITMLVFMLLTWILPAATYQTSYYELGRAQIGFFDIFSYQNTVLGYFGYIAVYILMVAGFYGVLYKTGAYRRILDAIVKKFTGKEAIVISIIMVIFAFLTSFCGVQLALILFFPFVISLVLMMGYSKLVAVAATAGSVAVGLMGTTFAYSTTQILQQYLKTEITTNIAAKIIILVIGLALLILNTFVFGKKKSLKEADDKENYIPEPARGIKKRSNWPLVIILDAILVVMILGFISWSGAFNITAFTEATNAVTEFEIGGFPLFGKILGSNISAFGSWTLVELIAILALAIIIIKFVYKIKWDDVMEGFGKGIRKAIVPALIVLVIYTCLVLTTYHPFQLVIYKAILGLTKGFNIFTTGLVVVVSSIINGDVLYAFYNVVPYFVNVITDTSVYPLVAVIFQSMYGLVTLVAPTSIPLMITLSYLNVPYKSWFKYIWKLLVALVVVLFIIFTILLLI